MSKVTLILEVPPASFGKETEVEDTDTVARPRETVLIGAMKGSSFGIADPPKPPPPAKTEVVCVEVTEVDGELVCCDGILFEPPPAGGQAGSLHSGH